MARTPQVTRTIITTKAIVLIADLKEKKTFEEEIVLPRTYKDEKALMKAVSKKVDVADVFKAVTVLSTETVQTLYGMDEQKFIDNAEILTNRN